MKRIATLLVLPILFAGCRKENGRGGDGADSRSSHRGENTRLDRSDGHSGSNLAVVRDLKSKGDFRSEAVADQLKKNISLLDSRHLIELLKETGAGRNTRKDRLVFTLAISELAKRDPQSVLAWYEPENMIQSEAGWIEVAGILASSNPDILKEWIVNDLKSGDKSIQAECYGYGLMALSSVDAKSALDLISKMPGDLLTASEIINSVFNEYGRQNPKEAESAAIERYKGADLDKALYNIALGAGGDPALAMKIAMKISDTELQGRAVASGIKSLLESDPASALAKIHELDLGLLQSSLQASPEESDSLVKKLAGIDPDFLCGLLGNVVATSANKAVFQAAVDSLVATRPEKALSLIDSLPDGEMKTSMVGSQFRVLASANPANATAKAARLANPDMRNRAFSEIGALVGSGGLDGTMKLAETLSENDRKPFMAAALPYLADQDPKKIASLLKGGEIVMDERNKSDLINRLGERLAGSDPTYAKKWIDGLPVSEQPHAMRGIASAMARNNIQGLATMLSSMPQDSKWESGVRVLIDNIRGSDPEMAGKWRNALQAAGYK